MTGEAPHVRRSGRWRARRSLQRGRRADATASVAQPGNSLSLWVRYKTGVQDRFFFAEGADASTNVYKFVEHFVNKEGLHVLASHVTLRWPKCTPDALDTSDEALPQKLLPWQTLQGAGVKDGHLLLADFDEVQGAGAQGAPSVRASCAARQQPCS